MINPETISTYNVTMQKQSFTLSILALALAAIFSFSSCEKDTSNFSKPLAGSLLLWGQSVDSVDQKMTEAGWAKQAGDKISASYQPSEEELKEFREANLLPDDAPAPYVVSFYFNANRLSIVRIIRRDTHNKIDDFIASAVSEYGLIKPDSEKIDQDQTTETGNKIKETTSLYETPDILARVIRVEVTPVEKEMQDGANDEVEFRIFSKVENKEISLEALQG